jgi:hypothetical protein
MEHPAGVVASPPSLPSEVWAEIAAFLTLEQRVRLAGTCKTIRDAIFCEPNLWKNISFSKLSGPRLTDEALKAFLSRCSALKIESLSLMHCRRLTGSGLAPLATGSVVLKEIELRTHPSEMYTHGPSGLDDEVVASHLRLSEEGSAATKVKKRQVDCSEDQMCDTCGSRTCEYCSDKVACCTYCKKDRCAHNVEVCEVCDCFFCMDQMCAEVGGFLPCSLCQTSLCASCQERCATCKNVVCKLCSQPSCEVCKGQFCAGCRIVGSCKLCAKDVCVGCKPSILVCARCNASVCEGCCRVVRCEMCNNQYCSNCALTNKCDVCDSEFCIDCETVEHCEACACCHCSECRKTHCEP